MQFLRENGLNSSLHALQEETGLTMNTVQNIDAFVSDVKAGRWDQVLSQVSSLQLPSEKLEFLYEQVVLELIEARELDLAKEVSPS